MKLKHTLSASVAVAVLLMTGCASKTGYDKADHTSTSVEKTAQKIHRGNAQIDAVLFAMSSLVNSPATDIKPQFEKFDSSVEKLESLSNDVNEQAASMQVKGADYFRNWDMELAKIQNEDIRERSTDRKAAVAARFDRVRQSYVRTKAAFIPFMSDLKDIRTALATDLTAGGLASIKGTANKANSNVTPLRESLSELEADFKALGISLSSTTASK
jgi:outer membrane murein-binding lipoprotein Lpp